MGTRRPLIVQMVHDSTAEEPRCRLQDEQGEEYGPVIAPPSAVADAIRDRTADHLAQVGGTVSSQPIVMRAEYAYCPNLTIVDTPGFILKASRGRSTARPAGAVMAGEGCGSACAPCIVSISRTQSFTHAHHAHRFLPAPTLQARKGEAASTPDDILAMVRAQCAPPNRLILFLQQSSVEWASSLWMHVLAEVDPDFTRTIVVASKFDNRLKEFGERWEVDRYLAAAGYLPPSVQPFFIALPKVSQAAGWPSRVTRCLGEEWLCLWVSGLGAWRG